MRFVPGSGALALVSVAGLQVNTWFGELFSQDRVLMITACIRMFKVIKHLQNNADHVEEAAGIRHADVGEKQNAPNDIQDTAQNGHKRTQDFMVCAP